jgi:hypothetical protein
LIQGEAGSSNLIKENVELKETPKEEREEGTPRPRFKATEGTLKE